MGRGYRPPVEWNDAKLNVARKILSKHVRISDALGTISKALGTPITDAMLRCVFQRSGDTPGKHLIVVQPRERLPSGQQGDKFSHLVQLVKKPIAFIDLCDKLNMSPRSAKEFILQARADGVKVHVEHDHVGLKIAEPLEAVQHSKISPVVGQRQSIGVITDTHLGSKYCLRDQIKDCVHYFYEKGIREILHIGDVTDGQYHHGMYEVTHVGADAQTRDLYETLPKLPGLRYFGITGNHDNTFTEQSGVDMGEFIESWFRKRGREDFKFYGNRGAFLKIRGAVVHMWHPRSGGAYAISYPLQKKIEGYASIKPQILLAGHWHRYSHCTERGIEALACPTFQAGRSAFSKSLTGTPAIGGLILSWDLTREGTMRGFALEKRMYFEAERPVEIFNTVDGSPVEPEEQLVEVRRPRQARKK